MRYTSARKVWHDCYSLSERSGSAAHMDPTSKRLNEFTQRAATTIHATETRSRRPGGLTDPEAYESFELVKAHGIIKAMPPHLRAWGMFTYTSQFTEQDHRRIQNYVYNWWWDQNNGAWEGDFVKTMRHLKLVECGLEDMRQRLTNGRRASKADMARLLDVSNTHWDRDGWGEGLDRIEGKVDRIDRDALQPIAKMIAEMREETEEESNV